MSRDNRHGEAELNVENYSFHTWFATGEMMLDPDAIREHQRVTQELRDRSSSVYSPVGRCAHCGASIKYHVVLRDERDNSLIAVGETCADNRFSLDQSSWKEYKDHLDAMRERARAGERRIKLRMEYPEAVEILEAALAANTAFHDQLEERYLENIKLQEAGQPDKGNSDLFRSFYLEWSPFIIDVAGRMARTGNLSPKQAEAVIKAKARLTELKERREEEEASSAPLPDFGDERVTIEGTVVSVKLKESQFGSRLKMLVRHDDGWKVWGSVPGAIYDVTKGSRVAFDATVSPSRDDKSFGFFNRPTKASVTKEEES